MRKALKFREIHYRWIGIFILAVFAELAGPDDHMGQYPIWYRFFVSAVFTSIYWNGAVFIFNFFRRKLPNIHQTSWRISLTLVSMFFWILLGGIPPKLVFGVCTVGDLDEFSTYTEFMAFSGLSSLIIGTIYESVYFFEKWKHAITVNEQLKSQQVRTQFEVLQNQMSPHFLFNSLNTLTTLIGENQKVAIEFTEKLSEVYRYILTNRDKELVPLSEELDFVNSYIFLLKMRYPDNLSIEINTTKKAEGQYIAPLTLQMLLENAIKHNTISNSKPLHVTIGIDASGYLMIKNNLQIKKSLEKSTQTGLANIRKRYELLGLKAVDVIMTKENFIVTIPLIDVEKHHLMQPV